MSAEIAPDMTKIENVSLTLVGVLHRQRSPKLFEIPLLTGNYVRRKLEILAFHSPQIWAMTQSI